MPVPVSACASAGNCASGRVAGGRGSICTVDGGCQVLCPELVPVPGDGGCVVVCPVLVPVPSAAGACAGAASVPATRYRASAAGCRNWCQCRRCLCGTSVPATRYRASAAGACTGTRASAPVLAVPVSPPLATCQCRRCLYRNLCLCWCLCRYQCPRQPLPCQCRRCLYRNLCLCWCLCLCPRQ